MSTQQFKVVLNSANFPFLFEQATRGVLVPGPDISPARTGVSFVGDPENIDWNTIQPLFMENVIPIAKGLMSVGFAEQLAAYDPPAEDFDQLILIRDVVNSNALFCPGGGKNYVYASSVGEWVSYSPFTFAYDLVTKAYVDGRTLICYERTKVVEYDDPTPDVLTRTLVLPAGYTMADIRGISGASNYLIAFTQTEVLWSTTSNILDLEDTDLGAGRQTPIDLKGIITSILPIAGGFLIYTTENIVAAFFTDSAATPFRFREVQNSAGVSSPNQVTGDATAAGHFVYGSAGLQRVTLQTAETVFAECADFLVSKTFEYWDTATKSVVKMTLGDAIIPKMQYLGSRYLFISYGVSTIEHTHALIFDTALGRWGKIRLTHVDINVMPLAELGSAYRYYQLGEPYEEYDVPYESLFQGLGNVAGIKQNFGFLTKTGKTDILIAEPVAETDSGTLLIGHVQVRRGHHVTFQQMELEGLRSVPAPVFTLLGSETGYKRSAQYTPMLVEEDSDFKIYAGRYTEKNFDIAIEGRFAMTSAILETTIHGKR